LAGSACRATKNSKKPSTHVKNLLFPAIFNIPPPLPSIPYPVLSGAKHHPGLAGIVKNRDRRLRSNISIHIQLLWRCYHCGSIWIWANTGTCGEENVDTGTVKWFNGRKGYGFIVPDDGGDDLFVHYSEIRSEGEAPLREGQKVEYEIGKGEKDHPCATKVCPC
jgi:CspA family cold shock protein